jgi:signal transduction histidine kinase/DNA-binding NarL/FixJ family response regulator
MFFAGENGLTTFFPDRIMDRPSRPTIVLTDFRLFNQPVAVGADGLLRAPIWETEAIALRYDQNIVSFEFAALSYAAPEHHRYRYILEGFEHTWNEVGSDRRFVTYTSLPPGRYTFRVQGSHADGVWSEHEAAVAITVTPPWWQTWWWRSTALGALVGGVFVSFRWRVRRMQERNRWLETQVAERTHELTERTEQLAHSNQALAAAKERAEAMSQAKSAFLSNMSHELRTPLNSILGYAQILERSPDLLPSQRDGVTTIYNSGKHLLTLISDALDLAKIEAGRLELHPTSLSLPSFLEGIVEMMQAAAQQKSLRLVYLADPHVLPSLLADEKRLRQVLLNLLGSAVKFTDCGQVTFRVTALSRAAVLDVHQRDTATLRFEIQDTGVGIAPEEVAKIFQPFEQAGAVDQLVAGTGLGLAISQQLVALMGGQIQVQSTVGQGSTFWFEVTFPVAEATATDRAEVPRKISGYEGRRRRVLVVDDRPENRLVLLDVLQPLGFEVAMATNGPEGIAQACQMAPDVIFMDLVMPGMMGFEAVTTIRHMPTLAPVPIIAVSASVHEIEQAESRRVGCDGFLPKPIDVEQLLAMLQRLLGLVWVFHATPARNAEENLGDDRAGTASPVALLPPPREELETLYGLARFGNMERIRERAQYLESLAEDYRPFARELCRLADEFDDEHIQQLVQHYLN